jgi:hypothetical protein
MSTNEQTLLEALWFEHLSAEGPLPALELTGPGPLLPSAFHVDVLASASIALSTACAASLWAERTGKALASISLDRRHAAAAFRSERYAKVLGQDPVPTWDPIAGDYETRDGFIRLHTNYRAHRAAVREVLAVPEQREAVAKAVRTWDAEALELRVVEAGGCAAMLRERAAFCAHAQGQVLASEPLFGASSRPAPTPRFNAPPAAPLTGVRVLDLTRVIAGPVATRFLAAYGADVLRIDPPGFEEVPALLFDTTAGKRRAALDLRSMSDRQVFERLLREAHVLVLGYRSDALARLGFDSHVRAQLNPGLVTVALDAYGHAGPWAQRRGFDSLVQMSSGIAAFGRTWKGCHEPLPLPVQALDHATGYLAAAAACHGLTRALRQAQGCEVRLSLARTAELLWQLGTDHDRIGRELTNDEVAPYLETVDTSWGRAQRLSCPGAIEGCAPSWSVPAGPLGMDAPTFQV